MRQELIDEAVERFAPHLAGYRDVKVIHLYSTNDQLRKTIREFAGGKTLVVEHCIADRPRPGINVIPQPGPTLKLPEEVDLVATKSALNSKIEWLAARLMTLPIVLPEATEWFLAKLDRDKAIVVVGGDQAK